jgi:hypothetical protein
VRGQASRITQEANDLSNAFSGRMRDRVGSRSPDIGKLTNPLDARRVHVLVRFPHQD